MASIDQVLKTVEAAPPRTKSVRIPLNPTAIARLAELEQAVEDARNRPTAAITDGDFVAEAQDELDAFRDEADDLAVTFTFRELKRPEWTALVRAHPSDDPNTLWNVDLFEPALVAASCIDPVMDVDQARRLFGSLGMTGATILYLTAERLQTQPDRVPFGGSGTAATRSSRRSSTTAGDGESPTDGSLADP